VTAGIDLKTLWTPYLTNQWKEFYSFLVTDVHELREVLISFWRQMSKVMVMAGRRHHISQTNQSNFTQFWSQMYLVLQCWLAFGAKGQGHSR